MDPDPVLDADPEHFVATDASGRYIDLLLTHREAQMMVRLWPRIVQGSTLALDGQTDDLLLWAKSVLIEVSPDDLVKMLLLCMGFISCARAQGEEDTPDAETA